LSIEWTQFQDWVQDIKNIFVHDLWATEFDKGRCLGPGYIWLRFGHGGPDYLSMHYNRYLCRWVTGIHLTACGALNLSRIQLPAEQS